MKKIVTVLAVAAVLLSQNSKVASFFSDSEDKIERLAESIAPVDASGEKASSSSAGNGAAKSNRMDGLEIPAYLTDRPEEVVRHTGYTVSYNRRNKLPNWVAWALTKEKTEGTVARSDDFQPDPDVRKGATAEDSDYRRSGYDRGHMCPAADNKFSETAMKECFYMSNICPQLHSLNAGDWKELEEKSRKWARRYGTIYIVCGPIVTSDSPEKIGQSGVVVPDAFYKVIMRYSDDNAVAIGFVYPNGKQNRPMKDYAMTVDEVEELTGINFFSKLPKNVERKAEATFNMNEWN